MLARVALSEAGGWTSSESPSSSSMVASSSNNLGDDAWLLQIELMREETEEVAMEEDEGDSLEVHPPASERGTLAGISTTPNPHQAEGTAGNPRSQEVQEGLAPRRPLHRLHRNNFHNLVHNYGIENTPRMHIPSNWDISCPRENDAGKSSWCPENKHIMVEVQRNTTMLQDLSREIQSLKDILLNVLKDKPTSSPPPSPKKET